MARKKSKVAKGAESPKPEAPRLGELGGVGLEDIGAAFADGLRVASDDVLQGRGQGDVAIYEKVLSDDQVHSTFQQRRLAVLSREWKVEAGADDPESRAAADDLEEQLERIEFDAVTYRMLTGVFFGFSVGECMFGVDGSRVTLDRILVRKTRRFRFDGEGKLRLRTRTNTQGSVMPDRKFWIFRAPSNDDDDPYGLGLGHFLYWLVWFKRNALRYWPLFLERFASPVPMAKVPPGTKDDERLKVMRLLEDIRMGGRLVVPSNVMLEFLQAMRSSGGDYHLFCTYLDSAIAKVVLSQTMTTDDGASRSQAVVHADVKLEVIKSDADLLCASFNRGPVRWLSEWNHPGAVPPRVWRRVVNAVDLNAQAIRDQVLYNIGYEPTQQYVDGTYGQGFQRRALGAEPPLADFAESIGRASDAIERLIGGEGWRPLMGPEFAAVEELVRDAGSLEAARERIGQLAARDPKALVDSLARVMFAARLAGEVGAELDGDG